MSELFKDDTHFSDDDDDDGGIRLGFNADLSNWETSGVTNMRYMFKVRSAHALWPPAFSRALPVHATCAVANTCPPTSPPAPRPALYALLATRQDAKAFNQPLSFDTSSVKDMDSMFEVRSARALTPTALSRALPVHARVQSSEFIRA